MEAAAVTTLTISLILVTNAPTSPDSVGVAGQVAIDKDFVYYCYAENKWSAVRVYNEWSRDTQ